MSAAFKHDKFRAVLAIEIDGKYYTMGIIPTKVRLTPAVMGGYKDGFGFIEPENSRIELHGIIVTQVDMQGPPEEITEAKALTRGTE